MDVLFKYYICRYFWKYDLIFQAIGVIGVDVDIAIALVDLNYIEIEPSPNPSTWYYNI